MVKGSHGKSEAKAQSTFLEELIVDSWASDEAGLRVVEAVEGPLEYRERAYFEQICVRSQCSLGSLVMAAHAEAVVQYFGVLQALKLDSIDLLVRKA